MFVAQEPRSVNIFRKVAIKRKAKQVKLWELGLCGKGGFTVVKACSHVEFRVSSRCAVPSRTHGRPVCRLSGFRRRRELVPKVTLDSNTITAPSRTGSQNNSTRTSPWLWAESGPGPRRQGSRLDGSRPEAAACSNQDAPAVKKILHYSC